MASLVQPLVRSTFFKQFCGGENVAQTRTIIDSLHSERINVILDYAAEPDLISGKDDLFFESVKKNVMDAIDLASKCPNADIVAVKLSGLFPLDVLKRLNSILVANGGADPVSLAAPLKDEFIGGMKRFEDLVRCALTKRIKITVDAEQSYLQNAIDHVVLLMMRKYNATAVSSSPTVFNTIQLYRRDSLARLQRQLLDSSQHNYHFGTKMVRGAYLAEEQALSRIQHTDVVFNTKSESDQAYNESILQLCKYARDNDQDLRRFEVILATHNHESAALATQLLTSKSPPANLKVVFAQLFGMSDSLSFSLARCGFTVYKYLPYGPIKDVMPYLLRRVQENASTHKLAHSEAHKIGSEIHARFRRWATFWTSR